MWKGETGVSFIKLFRWGVRVVVRTGPDRAAVCLFAAPKYSLQTIQSLSRRLYECSHQECRHK